MAREISQSVGRRGVNVIIDVMTVEELLNGVSPENGGPATDLEVDGQSNHELELAIHRFQLKQFGWSGADARVDPGHQTIRRLNELQEGPPTGNLFVFHRHGRRGGQLDPGRPQDWFFFVQLFRPGVRKDATFWFGEKGRTPAFAPPKGGFVQQKDPFIRSLERMSIDDLAGPAKIERVTLRGQEPPTDCFLRSRPPHRFSYSGLIDGELKLDHPKVIPMPVGNITVHRYNGFFQKVG